jgi:hypothetical protein
MAGRVSDSVGGGCSGIAGAAYFRLCPVVVGWRADTNLAIGNVMRNWPHVFSILNLFGEVTERLSAMSRAIY